LRCRALVTVVRRAEIILNCYNVFCCNIKLLDVV
jgi:hypothetical protein